MMKPMRDALPFNVGRSGASAGRREIFPSIRCCIAVCGVQSNVTPELPDGEAPLEVDRLWELDSTEKIMQRAYRVDAAILLLSVPILGRNGVGDARITLRQWPATAENGLGKRLALEFGAVSDPTRAHSLDRIGWIREVVTRKTASHIAPVFSAL